jgi:hypothetical protein
VVKEKALVEHLAATFAAGSYWGIDRSLLSIIPLGNLRYPLAVT